MRLPIVNKLLVRSVIDSIASVQPMAGPAEPGKSIPLEFAYYKEPDNFRSGNIFAWPLPRYKCKTCGSVSTDTCSSPNRSGWLCCDAAMEPYPDDRESDMSGIAKRNYTFRSVSIAAATEYSQRVAWKQEFIKAMSQTGTSICLATSDDASWAQMAGRELLLVFNNDGNILWHACIRLS